MAAFPSNNGQQSPPNNRAPDVTDPNGPDAQDKRVGKMHQQAHQSHKAQRNAVHAFGKKAKR